MKSHWLIMYDIRDEHRLRRVARTTEQMALRVQRSVFEAYATEQEIQRLKGKVAQLIEDEDVVAFIPLCLRDWSKRRSYGVGGGGREPHEKPYRIL